MKQNRSLKNLIIDPTYQLKYIFWLTVPGILLVLLNASIFYYYIQENYAILVELSPISDEARGQLNTELRQIIFYLGAVSLLFITAVSGIGLIFSHRTAGPMFHMKRVFVRIRAGDKKARVRLRPTDDFKDVAKEFNSMMDKLV